ncbi:hypothetical protein AAV98_01415 [Bacillus sp. CHD6a]|nr:hypothetical protein AAV98_01415 [Bacillus sp. CHD6a]
MPLGKRSHLRKSTAVFIKILKSRLFQWPPAKRGGSSTAPRKAKPFAEIHSGVYKNTKIKTFSVASSKAGGSSTAPRKAKPFVEIQSGV